MVPIAEITSIRSTHSGTHVTHIESHSSVNETLEAKLWIAWWLLYAFVGECPGKAMAHMIIWCYIYDYMWVSASVWSLQISTCDTLARHTKEGLTRLDKVKETASAPAMTPVRSVLSTSPLCQLTLLTHGAVNLGAPERERLTTVAPCATRPVEHQDIQASSILCTCKICKHKQQMGNQVKLINEDLCILMINLICWIYLCLVLEHFLPQTIRIDKVYYPRSF